MFKDPLTDWEGGFPYDQLEPLSVTPASSLKWIRDAAFTLMAEAAMTQDLRQAWDTLRLPARRLAVDFFLYRTEHPRLLDAAVRASDDR